MKGVAVVAAVAAVRISATAPAAPTKKDVAVTVRVSFICPY